MSAPTPLTAFADGYHQASYATAYVAGAAIVLLILAALVLGAIILWETVGTPIRRKLTSRRLHKAHQRSGRA